MAIELSEEDRAKYEASCERHKGYPNEAAARRAILSIRRRKPDNPWLNKWECPICEKWHVGRARYWDGE